MRARIGPLALVFVVGCASTVGRLPGDVSAPPGAPQGACESESWLVVGKTRSQEPTGSGRTTEPRDDGLGLYRVGASSPEFIPGLAEELGPSPLLLHHTEPVKRYDQKRWLAAGLGGVGIVALGVGSYFFATSFKTETTTASDGSRDEKQKIEGGRIALGTTLFVVGLGLGVGGLIVNPSATDRARADQQRYVFLPSEDNPEAVKSLVGKHNESVRDRCKR